MKIMEKFIGSVEHTLSPELVRELKARDSETKKKQWADFEAKLDAPNKKEIIDRVIIVSDMEFDRGCRQTPA